MKVIDNDPFPNKGAARFAITGGDAVGSQKKIQLLSSDPNGNVNGEFTHIWQHKSNLGWVDISGGETLIVGDEQEGKEIRVITSYIDLNGFAESVTTTSGKISVTPIALAREGLFERRKITLEFNRELSPGNVGVSKFQVKDQRRHFKVRQTSINAQEGTVTLTLNRGVTNYSDWEYQISMTQKAAAHHNAPQHSNTWPS